MSIQVDHVTGLIEDLSQSSKELAAGCDRSRVEMLQKAWGLFQALETPDETLMRMWLLEASADTAPCFLSSKRPEKRYFRACLTCQ